VYVEPSSVAEAVHLVASRDDAAYLAGGTNLVDLMKLGVESPGTLVDVTRILDSRIQLLANGRLRIGAAALNSDIAADPLVRADYPAVAQSLLAGASAQVRNRATAAGNLLQRTRCLYFQDVAKPCNKRVPGSGCPARGGEHRGLAVLGTSSDCIAAHTSDFAVALAAFDAVLHVAGVHGDRAAALDELYVPPGEAPHRETVLERGDLITAIELPATSADSRSAYRKVRDRAAFAFALVSAAVVVGGAGREIRIALGGVAPAPWRARRAEAMLRGRDLSQVDVDAALAAELSQAHPLPRNAFKVDLARKLAVAVVEELVA
jgi:xanthine dehydrogenase YagS FAD-binding subunit